MQKDEIISGKLGETSLSCVSNGTYIEAATSDNTRRAYQSDIEHFSNSGHELPATPEMIELYLKDCAHTLNPRTLVRRMTALRQWHRLQNVEDPTKHPLVTKTMKGIARLHGKPKSQALALRLEDLDKISAYLQSKGSLIDKRNRALVLLGFFGAFRRSELSGLKWEQIQFVREGVVILLPRSKTDQTGEGQQCVIPFGNEVRCPVRALLDWRQASKLWEGHVLRKIGKSGGLLKGPISPHHINRVIREIVGAAGLPNAEQYSAHSLRRGFATESARLGASMPAIQRHGRWKSTKTVVEYIESGRQFSDSAVNVLFDWK